MHPSIAAVAQVFGASTALFEKALAGLDREALLRRPGTETNPILWIAGHLASSRYGLATALGRQRDVPWGTLFFKGAAVGDLSALPEVGSIQEGWREISALLAARLEELTEAELAAPFPRSFPIPDRSLRGAITFLAFHEGYHLGQMALLRKWLGLPGLVDG
ncbi:MAG TPA: DinB family protein [Vicinamibacteria bacterium]|nr:DinB family protein [Vicinamibacteria bacterium]